tara:strand:- start:46 stop:1791 length:1746 start_codon:yes stop_codon:yes gene_type:complete
MSNDRIVYDLSQEMDTGPSNIFTQKSWINLIDNQQGSYISNQSVLDSSSISNSNKYASYKEAYLSVPLLITLSTAPSSLAASGLFAPATPATSCDFALGLKNWYGNIVHSMTLDYNGSTIVQQTPYINMYNGYKLMTTLSYNDVISTGASIGFFPDSSTTYSFNPAGTDSLAGTGVCNNSNVLIASTNVSGRFNEQNAGQGNEGFLRRQSYINYDPDGNVGVGSTKFSSLLNAASSQSIWKSYISTKTNGVNGTSHGVFQISVMSQIYLRHLHSWFQNIPLIKNCFMKLTLNLNNTSFQVTNTSTAMVLTSVTNNVGGCNPLMIASAAGVNGSLALKVAASFIANLSVGAVCLDSTIASYVPQGVLSRNIYMYVPVYSINPIYEAAYLSSPLKQVVYTDVYQYSILGVAPNQQINNLITNGIANVKSILLMNFYSPTSSQNTGLPLGVPVFQSPFESSGSGGCSSPLVALSNFNCVLSGQNVVYNTQRYSFEQFEHNNRSLSINGGLTDGLSSGLINRLDFDNIYSSYYLDLSRMLEIENSVPKSISIIGQNVSSKTIDCFIFVEYGVSVTLDVLTGVRVS